MPAPAIAMLSVLMLAQSPGASLVDKVASQPKCRVIIDDVCRVEAKAGDGGAGGNAVVNYNFYLGGPTAGNGGNGGNAIGGVPKGVPVKPGSAPGPQAVVPPGPPVSLTLSRCKLTIAGKAEVDAKQCKYEKVGNQFVLTAPSENQKYVYTIKVAWNDDKVGRGSLSGGRTAAVRDLGTLTRRKACWVKDDETVEICAWK